MKPTKDLPSQPNKSRLIIGVMLALVVAGGAVSLFKASGGKSHNSMLKKNDVVTITLPPPPPPPLPPPPPPPPPKEQEMVQQQPVDTIPEDNPTPAQEDPGLSTNIVGGNGPDLGLRAGSGNGNRNRIGSGRRSGKWDHYAVSVQKTIAETLRHNSGVRHATFSLQVRVWADPTGRITRAALAGSSGDPAVDNAIKNNALAGLQLPEPPPADMPMPITMRISARKSAELTVR